MFFESSNFLMIILSSRTDLYNDNVVDVTSFSALDVVEIKLK